MWFCSYSFYVICSCKPWFGEINKIGQSKLCSYSFYLFCSCKPLCTKIKQSKLCNYIFCSIFQKFIVNFYFTVIPDYIWLASITQIVQYYCLRPFKYWVVIFINNFGRINRFYNFVWFKPQLYFSFSSFF